MRLASAARPAAAVPRAGGPAQRSAARWGESPDALAATLARADTGTRAQIARVLQGSVGNRALARAVACPRYQPGEERKSLTAAGHLEPDVTETGSGQVVIADFGVDRRSVKDSARNDPTLKDWLRTYETDDSYRLSITGYSDCHGDNAKNVHLRQGRAKRVEELLGPGARSRVEFRGMASLDQFLAPDNATPKARAENRAVVIEARQQIEGEAFEVTARSCTSPVKATSISDYISLVMCAEKEAGYTPRQMLSFLRKLYYSGASWGVCGQGRSCRAWGDVITCGVDVGDPTKLLRKPLLDALRQSQVIGGVDMGHLFTGLEAMVCPKKSVEVEIPGPNMTVAIPNEDFATWAGDLGSAAAMKVRDEQDRGQKPKRWSYYIGTPGSLASEEDLTGDIDAFVVRAALSGKGCGPTAGTTLPSLTDPMSKLLFDLYKDPSSKLGAEKTKGIRCFVQALGGQIGGSHITNRIEFTEKLAARIFKFADFYYTGKVHPYGGRSAGISSHLYSASYGAAREFVTFLEKRL